MFYNNDEMFFYWLERFFRGLGKVILAVAFTVAFMFMLILFS